MTSSFLCSLKLIAHRQPTTQIAHWNLLWGDKESIYPKSALVGRKNYCAITNTVFFPISEVSEGTVSL